MIRVIHLALAALAAATPAAAADRPALRAAAGQYMSDLMKRSEFRTPVQKTLGARTGEFRSITGTQIPSELIDNRYLVAQGCKPHDCPSHGAIVGIDTRSGEVIIVMAHLKRTRAMPFVTLALPRDYRAPPPLAAKIADWSKGIDAPPK